MKTYEIIIGVLLFALAGAVLYVWGLKKSVSQGSDMERNLLHACGSRVVKALKKKESLSEAEIAALIEGITVGQFWSRQKMKVQNGAKVAPSVIAFLLAQQYLESCGKDPYRRKK